jgi:hypothetical protein
VRAARWRSLGALGLAGLLGLQLLALVGHGIDSRHRYCPEHGRLEEVATAAGGRAESTAAVSPARDTETAGHEACVFASVFRQSSSAPERRAHAAPAVDRRAPELPEPRDVPPPIAVLRRAPKGSPPPAPF